MNIPNQTEKPELKSIKELRGTLDTSSALLLSFVAALLCAFAPISLFYNMTELAFEGLSLVVLAATLFAFYRMIGMGRAFVILAIISGAAFLFSGVSMISLPIAFVVSVSLIAYILLTADSIHARIIAILSSVLAFVVSVLLTGTLFGSALAFLPLAAALALYYSVIKCLEKVSAICHISAALIICVFGALAVKYLLTFGADATPLVNLINEARETVTSLTSQALFTAYGEIMSISMTDAEALSSAAVNATFNLLPAIIVIIANLFSFFIHSTMLSALFSKRDPVGEVKEMMLFDMSIHSAIIFLSSFFLALILSVSEVSVWSVTLENVAVILMPAMVLTGVMMLRGLTMHKKGSCFVALVYFASIFLIFYIPTVMLPIASVAGAVTVILNTIAKRKLKK